MKLLERSMYMPVDFEVCMTDCRRTVYMAKNGRECNHIAQELNEQPSKWLIMATAVSRLRHQCGTIVRLS